MLGLGGVSGLENARKLIAQLTNHEMLEHRIPKLYLPEVVSLVHQIAAKALAEYEADVEMKDKWVATTLKEIKELTSRRLRKHKLYIGDRETLVQAWCEATACKQNTEYDRFVHKGDITGLTLGELWAGSEGMKCEHESGCSKRTFTIYVTRKEYNSLLYKPGSSGFATCLFEQKLGKALCEEHQPEAKNPQPTTSIGN